MTLAVSTILGRVESHAAASGYFERVNRHEPKNAPGNRLSCAIWVDQMGPIKASGLNSTSARMVVMVRIYSNMLQEPQDQIDPDVVAAADYLMGAYTGDFELGANVKNIDLLGAHGIELAARAGYLSQDGKMFRVMDITLPIIVNDLWSQAP